MDGSIQFGLLEMQLIHGHIVIMLCNIVVLWFWVSVAPNFNNCLGAREEGLILLGNDDSIRMGCALRWKRDVQPWLVGNE